MANTTREATAGYGSEIAVELAGSGQNPALGFGPHHSTSVYAVLQGLHHLKQPIRELMPFGIDGAIEVAPDRDSNTPGSTADTGGVR